MSLSLRLKSSRKKAGLSQSALAERCDVSQPTVANWERGGHTPRADAVNRLASALGVDPVWLLSGELPPALNPAHQHLAKPILHVPVYHWPEAPSEAEEPLVDFKTCFPEDGPAQYITLSMTAGDVFAVMATEGGLYPDGTILLFDRTAQPTQDGSEWFGIRDGRYMLDARPLLDQVFGRLVYSIVPH